MIGWTYLGFEAAAVFGSFNFDNYMTGESRLAISRAFFAIANGPLATALYNNGDMLVFHDIERMSSGFIHFMPALVSYSIRWLLPNSLGLFKLDEPSSNTELELTEHLFINPMKIYFCWFSVYSIWLMTIGCTLVGKPGWDKSSFGDNKHIFKKIVGDNIRAQAMGYLVGHVITTSVIMFLIPRIMI